MLPAACPCLQVKDQEAARQTWLRVVALEPSNGHACHALGMLEQQEGHFGAAEQWLRRGCDSAGACARASSAPLLCAGCRGGVPGRTACRAGAPDPASCRPRLGLPALLQTARARCCAMKGWQSFWPSRARSVWVGGKGRNETRGAKGRVGRACCISCALSRWRVTASIDPLLHAPHTHYCCPRPALRAPRSSGARACTAAAAPRATGASGPLLRSGRGSWRWVGAASAAASAAATGCGGWRRAVATPRLGTCAAAKPSMF